jgi:hypothetical protein
MTDIVLALRHGRTTLPAAVRKNLSIACVLLAWLCANGAFWHAAQAFAWGRMFAGYARTLSITSALRETFDPAKPCDLCVSVQKARSAGETSPLDRAAPGGSKVDLVCETPAQFVFTTPRADWPPAFVAATPSRTEPVPVPPPRA